MRTQQPDGVRGFTAGQFKLDIGMCCTHLSVVPKEPALSQELPPCAHHMSVEQTLGCCQQNQNGLDVT